jgi:Protein of unknown function (DUF2628)
MAIYTVHEPPLRRYESSPAPERFAFVRDGFHFWAFVLGPLWMLRHRMWLVLIGYVVVFAALQVALHFLGVSDTVKAIAGLLLGLLVGIEAGTLRRFTLGRRGWRNVAVVVGDDIEMAERRFFDSWVNRSSSKPESVSPSSPPAVPPSYRLAPASPEIIGLFPKPGASR